MHLNTFFRVKQAVASSGTISNCTALVPAQLPRINAAPMNNQQNVAGYLPGPQQQPQYSDEQMKYIMRGVGLGAGGGFLGDIYTKNQSPLFTVAGAALGGYLGNKWYGLTHPLNNQ